MIMSTLAMNEGDSLLLIDELGRGTNHNEGVGLAHALSEGIINSKVSSNHLFSSLANPLLDFLLFRNSFQGQGSFLSHYG